MKLDSGDIPKKLYDLEESLRATVQATDAFIEQNRNVFEQFQELVEKRNTLIDECKKLCKQHGCSTSLFKTNVAHTTEYNPESFLKVFGPKKLAQACEVSGKKVRSMVECDMLDSEKLKEVESAEKETARVESVHKKWEIS